MNAYQQRKKSPEQRFAEKINKTDSCWLWTSAFGDRGYGVFWVGGTKRSVFAHRYSYELHKGGIPDGQIVMHSCDNPACVNPDHLSTGTYKDNTQDAYRKNRRGVGSNATGSKPSMTELTAQRLKIVLGCLPRATLAELFGISVATLKNVRRERNWKHISANTRQALAF